MGALQPTIGAQASQAAQAGQVAQAPRAATRAAAPSSARYVAIGCVSRVRTSAGAIATPRRYVLTDPRGDKPTTYRLEGLDEDTLDFHAGHTLEVAGSLSVAAGANGALTMKVASLTYISRTCTPPGASR